MQKKLLIVIAFSISFSFLNAQYLSSSVTRDGYQMWEPSISSATQVVMQQLNKGKSATEALHLDKINLEHTKVSQGVMYTMGLEMDMATLKNARYEFSFLQPSGEWQTLWGSLPGLDSPAPSSHSTPLSNALALANDHHHYHHPQSPALSMTLRGPLEVYLHDSRTAELHIKAPREVDVGYVNKITLANGVNMTVSGFHELYLTEPLTLRSPPTIVDGTLQMAVKAIPKVAFVGRTVEITNVSANEPLKVKKKGYSEIEIVSATDAPISTELAPFELSINDSRVQTLQYFLAQLATSTKSSPVVRRLFSAKLEAVTTFFLPIEVSSAHTGERSDWNVIVAQTANKNDRLRIVSLEKQRIGTELAFDSSLVANNTLAEALNGFLASHHEYRVNL